MPKELARMLSALVVAGIATLTVPGLTTAATPTKGARYSAKIKTTHSNAPQLDLTVASGGKRLSVFGPHEECGRFSGGERGMFGQLANVRIDAQGRFKGSTQYTVGWGDHRYPSPASINDYTYRWTINVSGRFIDKRTAKGTITYEVLAGGGRSDYVAGHMGQPLGQTGSCGKVSVKFTAKRGALRPIYIGHVVGPDEF